MFLEQERLIKRQEMNLPVRKYRGDGEHSLTLKSLTTTKISSVSNNKGDPIQLLKSINPSEAMLLDPASKCHLRFRLGGEKFPPLIYYKIFTHAPL